MSRTIKIEYEYRSDENIREAFKAFPDYAEAALKRGWEYEPQLDPSEKEWRKIVDDPAIEDLEW